MIWFYPGLWVVEVGAAYLKKKREKQKKKSFEKWTKKYPELFQLNCLHLMPFPPLISATALKMLHLFPFKWQRFQWLCCPSRGLGSGKPWGTAELSASAAPLLQSCFQLSSSKKKLHKIKKPNIKDVTNVTSAASKESFHLPPEQQPK